MKHELQSLTVRVCLAHKVDARVRERAMKSNDFRIAEVLKFNLILHASRLRAFVGSLCTSCAEGLHLVHGTAGKEVCTISVGRS